MNTEEHDKLWEMLGKARPTKVSPFFARNVVRQIRLEEPAPSGVLVWLRQRWRMAALAGGMAVALVVFGMSQFGEKPAAPLIQQIAQDPDYEVIVHLDELIAYEQNNLWLENSTF